MLLRFYIIIVLCFFKQEIKLDQSILDQVNLRDIKIKSSRKTIYNWNGDWLEEVFNWKIKLI